MAMKTKLPSFLMFVAFAAILLPSCSKDDWQEGDAWYDEWATCYFFGNGLGDRSSFMLDIRQGYTTDGEALVSGKETHLLLSAPPVTDSRIPSGEYVVSDIIDHGLVVKKGMANLADGSYFAFCDRPRQKWERVPIESGKVRVDQHADGYDIRLRVVAGGGYYDYRYSVNAWTVNVAD